MDEERLDGTVFDRMAFQDFAQPFVQAPEA
jgi:hypothetical protein